MKLTPSGPVTHHLVNWSNAKTISATVKPRRYLSIHHLVAAGVELARRIHVGHVAPAALAFPVIGFRHLDLIAPTLNGMNCRGDEQLGEQRRVGVARD